MTSSSRWRPTRTALAASTALAGRIAQKWLAGGLSHGAVK